MSDLTDFLLAVLPEDEAFLVDFYSREEDNEKSRRILALPYADHPDYREEWKP